MQVELEDALGNAAAPVEGKTLYVSLVSGIVVTLLALIGWIIKNRTDSQRVDSVSADITVETLGSSRKRIRELEEQLRDSLNREIANSQAHIAASSAAQKAADKAEHASALAEEAQRQAIASRDAAIQAEVGKNRAVAYYKLLQGIMIQAGLTPPPEPEL